MFRDGVGHGNDRSDGGRESGAKHMRGVHYPRGTGFWRGLRGELFQNAELGRIYRSRKWRAEED